MIDYQTATSQSCVLKFTMKQWISFKFYLVAQFCGRNSDFWSTTLSASCSSSTIILLSDAVQNTEQWTKLQVTEVTEKYKAIVL